MTEQSCFELRTINQKLSECNVLGENVDSVSESSAESDLQFLQGIFGRLEKSAEEWEYVLGIPAVADELLGSIAGSHC